MTLNCKVGDLAIVVRATHTPEMVGLVVRVVAPFCGEFQCRSVCGMSHSVWRGAASASWVVESGQHGIPSRSLEGGLFYYKQRVVMDAILRPIRPLDEPETITTDDEVTA